MEQGSRRSVDPASDLRQRAEKMLRKEAVDLKKIGTEGIRYSLHELQVHQIELELQNEELRRAQQELAASREKYFDLYDLAPVGYLTISEKGLILEANLTAASLLGLERAHLIKQPVTRFVFREDQDVYYRHRKQLLETQAPQTAELRIVRKDGPPIWVQLDATLAQTSDDKRLCRTTISDITNLKRAEEQRSEERRLLQTQKLESLGVLAGGVAHDFNNLLAAILGQADLARQEVSPLSPARERIQRIIEASQRASDLCLQMLAYAGKSHTVLERVDLRALVAEMTDLLKACINKKAILNLKFEQETLPIKADASQIRQVVMNLIINASEAIGDRDGVITISTGVRESDQPYLQDSCLENDLPRGLYTYLEVSDTGCGIDQETKKRIFEPFFTTKFTGRGLGLAAVLGIVRTHGGTLKLGSEPGKGTTFSVLFPALPPNLEEETETRTEARAASWRGRGTLLFVDDEEIVRAVAREILEGLGFSVLTAADGREALDLYRERGEEISVVVLDTTMPRMDGEETFRELRRLNPGLPVILSSGYAGQDVVSRFKDMAPNAFIQKPYTIDHLQATLARVMSNYWFV
jgi:PAS domain S-box-containing protein